MSDFILRDYQEKAVTSVRDSIRAGNKRAVMVMPTGGGKSLCFAEIIRLALSKGNKCLFLVHRRNLVEQFAETVKRHVGCDVGIIMSGHQADTDLPVQIATIQTFWRRLNLEELQKNKFFFQADVVMVDEAHTAVSKRYSEVLKLYGDKIIIGCTATPMRADGRGLGEIFDSLVNVVGVKELTDRGYLAPARYFVPPSQPDLTGIKIARGDYEVGELGKRMSEKKLIGDIVDNWLKIAGGLKTIVFCVNVKHAIAVAEEFRRVGIAARHLSARSTDEEREQAFTDMDKGRLQVICNVALYIEGMDSPDISCVVMARPTKSLGLYRQACGRGLRPNGTATIIIDHGGVVEEHGLLDEELVWSLDGKEKAWKKTKKKENMPKVVQCIACNLVFTDASICPDCGTPVRKFGKAIETVDADLEELNKKEKGSVAEKRRFLGMLKAWVPRQNNPNPKRINGAFKGRYGVWPHHSYKYVAPIEPDAEFLAYMKHQAIRWAKRNG